MASRHILSVLWLFIACAGLSNALYFYLDGPEQKCFLEQLPKDTVLLGTYRSEEWSESAQQYLENTMIGIQIVVDEFESKHRIVNQRGASSGRFTFTSTISGEHKICLSTNSTGWFQAPKVKLHLDLVIGDAANAPDDDHSKMNDIATRVRDLVRKVGDIRREQIFQREKEAEFRDLSELVNARIVHWTIVQICVLAVTCVWQLRHLRTFFTAKKLV
ncbi:emp24/gp25L/p24 family/GOLD-domain-containing protein [Paraphysoderma sedebokerense]|nr:emp24/gp25L/p24 family/GOLD-domain-containing protein [Paraphysoderma sedebokerense]